MTPTSSVDRIELEQARCWFAVDRVSSQPAVTSFKRRARLHQARWRERHGLKMGSHYSGSPRVERPNGSRIELAQAKQTETNLLSDRIRTAAKHRLDSPQLHETLDADRLWSDLLSSMPMCFNLFGELQDDPDRLASATVAPGLGQPGIATSVQFEWSPGRLDRRYLGDRTAFDAAIMFTGIDETKGIVGIETKYHEHIVREKPPHPCTRLPRYRDVTEQSNAFKRGWEKAIVGTELQQIWRDHLLILSMLQHEDAAWASGRYVLIHPAENPSFAEAGARYRDLLANDSTFEVRTIEQLLDAHVLHPAGVEDRFRRRYLW